MAHYLYVLQTVRLNHLEPRMRTPLDSYSQVHSPSASSNFLSIFTVVLMFLWCFVQEQRDMLHGLRQAAFETESESGLSNERRRSLCAKEFKKLGFSVSLIVLQIC